MASAAIDRRRGALVTRGILVTVHDLYGGKLPLLPLELYFQLWRHHDVQPFRYHPSTQNLATSGKALGEFLRSQKPHTTDEAINFVTHGYGALVLREAFRYVDWNYTKSKVVMLAPPNRGIRYYAAMKKHIGIVGYGGVAAEELATLTHEELDLRLGKLPRRCYPLILSGSLSLNPFNQANYPNDGTVTVEETTLPGEFRHQVKRRNADDALRLYQTNGIACTLSVGSNAQVLPTSHYLLPSHPSAIYLTQSFLEA